MVDSRLPSEAAPQATGAPSLPADDWLHGKVAVVTGGGRGLGAAIAEELAARGAALALLGRTAADLEAAARRLSREYGIDAAHIVCDVTDQDAVAAAFGAARERLGEPFVLVNNAGQSASSRFVETSRETWERMLAVNVTAAFLCTREVLPAMLETGSGRVVNISSTAGLKGYSHTAAYCASKHALVGMTRSVAVEVARTGVTVNAVCPGYADTDMAAAAVEIIARGTGKSTEEALALLLRPIPRKRLTAPAEVASLVGWLCSPGAAGVTGAAIPVAGGEV